MIRPLRIDKMAGYAFGSNPPCRLRAFVRLPRCRARDLLLVWIRFGRFTQAIEATAVRVVELDTARWPKAPGPLPVFP
jgi:hypothetical protein